MTTQHLHTYCAMCISRCGVIATVKNGRLTGVNADPDHPNGCICVKGTAAPEIVYSKDRLRTPLKRTRPKGEADPGWVAISWDEALSLAAGRLAEIKSEHGAESVIFAFGTPSGGGISDSARWLERLANAFGSPNLWASLSICNWNREWGSQYTYGAATPPPDYDKARCIMLWGFNPYVSWPAAATRINRAKAAGAKLIVIDPHHSNSAQRADLWLRVRPGADGALALSMIHILIDEKLLDAGFVRDWTNAPFLVRADNEQLLTASDLSQSGDRETFFVWDDKSRVLVGYRADQGFAKDGVIPALTGTHHVTLVDGTSIDCRPAFQSLVDRAAPYAPERAESLTDVAAQDLRRAVRMFALERPSCYYTWAGLEQHRDATQTNRAIGIFYALTGQFDQCGGNLLYATTPVQPITGQELLPRELVTRRLGYAELPLGSPGLSGRIQTKHVYDAILRGNPYPIKALISFGGDPLLAYGDAQRGQQALSTLDFFVDVDIFANPSSNFADLVLPASTCWEHEGLMPSFATAEETAIWAQLRPAVVEPEHESRADIEIIFDLARRLGLNEQFFGGDIDAAYNYHLAPSGLTVEQLRANRIGMRAPVKTQYQKYAEIELQRGRPRGFRTPTGKIEIYSTRFAESGHSPLPAIQIEQTGGGLSRFSDDYPLILTSFRLLQFCDQQHRNIAPLRRQALDPFLEINSDTAASLNINDGERIKLETPNGEIRLKAKLNASLHPKVVATQYGWWQECKELNLPGQDPLAPNGANVNLIISNEVSDPISGAVPHRSQPCRVRKEL